MKRTTIYTAGVIGLVALLAVPFAFAQRMRPTHGDGGPGFGMMFGRLEHAQQALGLSDQQVSDIRDIFQSLREQNAPYRESQRTGMRQIAETLIANPNDIAGAQALIDQQTANERTVRMNTLNAMSKALNVLTPDQRAKLGTFLQGRMQRGRRK